MDIVRFILICCLMASRPSMIWLFCPLGTLLALVVAVVTAQIVSKGASKVLAAWKQAVVHCSCRQLGAALFSSIWYLMMAPTICILFSCTVFGVFLPSFFSWTFIASPSHFAGRYFDRGPGQRFSGHFVGELLDYVLNADCAQTTAQRIVSSNYLLMAAMAKDIESLDERRNKNRSPLLLVNFLSSKHNANRDGEGLRSLRARDLIYRVGIDRKRYQSMFLLLFVSSGLAMATLTAAHWASMPWPLRALTVGYAVANTLCIALRLKVGDDVFSRMMLTRSASDESAAMIIMYIS